MIFLICSDFCFAYGIYLTDVFLFKKKNDFTMLKYTVNKGCVSNEVLIILKVHFALFPLVQKTNIKYWI